jgi:hypothetical protein
VIYSESSEYLKRYYSERNAVGKNEIKDRIEMLVGTSGLRQTSTRAA